MNRRNFLKLSAMTGIAVLVPLEFIIDNRDNETKFLDYIITTYNDEIAVIQLIKEYGCNTSQGRVTTFFREFVQRQPHVVSWLRERVKITVKPDGTRVCSNQRYQELKTNIIKNDEWRDWGKKTYKELDRKFNLTPKEILNKRRLVSQSNSGLA